MGSVPVSGYTSVFDMFKVCVGPSSSHTLGPWRAAQRFLAELDGEGLLGDVEKVSVELYGSLAKTGRGHGTGVAVLMGLMGEDPETCDTSRIPGVGAEVADRGGLDLLGRRFVPFSRDDDLVFRADATLPDHPNGLRFTATVGGEERQRTYYSVGGGFVVAEGESPPESSVDPPPYPCERATDILDTCVRHDLAIHELVLANEAAWRSPDEVRRGVLRLRDVMVECAFRGCHTDGELPGGLRVTRRAPRLHRELVGDQPAPGDAHEWLASIRAREWDFEQKLAWVSCLALAVNEENAAFGRVVTAPTNGAAGVVPAVLCHLLLTSDATDDDCVAFLLTASEIGALFKRRATISAALGGCQAEIGVSSAMAAAALAERRGATVAQALAAAEIAMEHHLGLTCDPIGGLVQIPCIERNAMGAVKAITAANLAAAGDPAVARVSLDAVIETMWDTAKDMDSRYKETAEGGLALKVAVSVIEC